jgi:4-hydroxybenzoate polyprenyltransferase
MTICRELFAEKLKSRLAFVRTLLALGRVSNLPTVWSNCLAGWWLGGAGNVDKLPYLLAGATALYNGGMFLNDAFDVEFDRQYRKERPIPSRAIGLKAVWVWGSAWLALGVCCLAWTGSVAGVLGIALAGCIVLYDAVHKRVSFAPGLMGLCRFVLYLVAASTAVNGLNSKASGSAGALFAYIVGLSYVARRESAAGPLRYWPILFVAMPIVVALLFNHGYQVENALLLSAIFLVWTVKSLRYTLWTDEPNIGRTVSGLLAGIVLVDLLAVANAPREFGVIFIGLFLTALLFQRFVPAT